MTRSRDIDMTTILQHTDSGEKELKVKLIGRRIHVLRGTTGRWDGKGYKSKGLYLTERRGDYSQFFEIMGVSEDCKYFDQDCIGAWIQVPLNPLGSCQPVGKGNTELLIEESYWEKKDEKGKYPALVVFWKE